MVRAPAALFGVVVLALAAPAWSVTLVVAESGGDFTSIQAALDVAGPGDVVEVREKATPYFEKLVFPRDGTALDGPIVLRAAAGETPILDGTGIAGEDMVRIEDRSYVQIIGFVIRNNLGVADGSGIRVLGAGAHIEVRDNEIHDIRGDDAMGITVYGTASEPISDLVIDGNDIHDCEPAQSEALTLNGNVTNFAVTNNVVRDVNNIGIDFIGGETDIQPDPSLVVRNGVCAGNTVLRANSNYGGGFAAGIYVDGARDIVIENNFVSGSDLGIEIGAENAGLTTTGIVVRNNVLWENEKVGLVFGGYNSSVGRVENCEFRNNTLYRNDTLAEGFGQIWVQWAQNNVVRNNIAVADDENLLVSSYGSGNQNNTFDYNLFFAPGGAAGARFVWNDEEYVGFGAYQSGAAQGAHSIFVDPLLVSPATEDFHVDGQSPAVNAGDPATAPGPSEVDLDGAPRLSGPRVDIGADEISCGDGVQNPGEQCDDGNVIDGDGCDSNCTITGCGNAVITAGEQCDDGNTDPGDCCDPSCQIDPDGTTCDDGRSCTRLDMCSAGVCGGTAAPDPACRVAGKSVLRVKPGPEPSRDRLVWVWKKGAATALADFGNPMDEAAAAFDLCLFDGNGSGYDLEWEGRLPAGGHCTGKQCWKALRGKGFKYQDTSAARAGVGRLILKAGDEGRPSVVLKAQGAALQMPGLPFDEDPDLTLQLRNDLGVCWGATFSAAVSSNGPTGYKAKSP